MFTSYWTIRQNTGSTIPGCTGNSAVLSWKKTRSKLKNTLGLYNNQVFAPPSASQEGKEMIIIHPNPSYIGKAWTLLSAMPAASTLWVVPVLSTSQTATERSWIHFSPCTGMGNADYRLWGLNKELLLSNPQSTLVTHSWWLPLSILTCAICRDYLVGSSLVKDGLPADTSKPSTAQKLWKHAWRVGLLSFPYRQQICSLKWWKDYHLPPETEKAKQGSSLCAIELNDQVSVNFNKGRTYFS